MLNHYVNPTTGKEEAQAGSFGAAHVTEQSILASATAGVSEAIALTATASAVSSAITAGSAVVTPTVDCFFRQAVTPVALLTGVDQILLAGNSYRINGITSGNKLAFISTSAGTVYVTPGA